MNFSLLYSPNLQNARLAPAYDLVSTTVYESSTREMAFGLGPAVSIDDIREDSFREAAREIGLGEGLAMNHYDTICRRFPDALQDSCEELTDEGFDAARELARRIRLTGCSSRLF